jgi:hypothetical protein
MKQHRVFQFFWYATDVVLVVSFLLVIYGAVREYSTTNYLKGFSDAIVPASGTADAKVEAILAWMRHGPARRTVAPSSALSARDPEDTLNYQGLLTVCGSATNAFVNLAQSSGLRARRLLLLDPQLNTKHVVAEVMIDGRWAVVDPSYRFVFRDAQGQSLTRQQLKDPAVFRQAIQDVPGYPQDYTYERTVHVHLARIPFARFIHLRRTLNRIWPNWEEAANWTYVLERESFALFLSSFLLFSFALGFRLLLSWYGSRRLSIRRVGLRDQLQRAGETLFSHAK